MAIKNSGDLYESIAADLADNNAGLISAEDVRHNILDIVESLNQIVASGNFNTKNPFRNQNVRAQINSNNYGKFIAESGVEFPNATWASDTTQYEPYPGVGLVDHNSLNNLNVGDPHGQYVPISGTREMLGNLKTGGKSISASGENDRGIKFIWNSSFDDAYVGSGTNFVFDDGSKIGTGKSVAKAWMVFDGNDGSAPVIRESYNIHTLTDNGTGKYTIKFVSGVLGDNNYAAVGNSNATTASGSKEDFDNNTVGLVLRDGNDASSLRSITYVIRKESDNSYVDGHINDLIVFGLGSGVHPDDNPTIA
tara:strand:+ start:1138 stop:2061 length:924 start_codon:yes stop_codon:yes gene_type:complete